MKRFLRYCKHCLQAMGEHPLSYALICVELILTLLSSGFILNNFSAEIKYGQAMRSAASHKNMYVVKDRSEIYTIMNALGSPEGRNNSKELFDYVSERVTAYVHLDATVRLDTGDFRILLVNKPFFHLYPFTIEAGREFTDAEWNMEETETLRIPVIVGAGLKKQYPVGSEFYAADDPKRFFYVVGAFAEDAFYLNPTITFDTISLDQAIVAPWFPAFRFNNGYQNVNLIHLMQVETEEEEVLELIAEKSRSLGLFDLDFYPYEGQIAVVTERYIEANRIWMIILSTILLYCVAGSILVLLNYIQHHMKSSVIYMICGATKKELGIELLFQIALPLLIGFLLSCVVFRSSLVWIGNLLIGMLLGLIIWIIPKRVWDKNTLSTLFKRYD